MERNFDDIISLSRPESPGRPPMPMLQRAAQFSPFAALSGMEERFDEEMRYTDEQIELTEDKIEEIDRNIRLLSEAISGKKTADAVMTWFVPDLTKDGGMYRTDRVSIRKIDAIKQLIVLTNSAEIPIANVTDIYCVESRENNMTVRTCNGCRGHTS